MIDLGNSKSYSYFKTLNSIFSQGAQPNITSFNALNDGVNQTYGTYFFTCAVSIELWSV